MLTLRGLLCLLCAVTVACGPSDSPRPQDEPGRPTAGGEAADGGREAAQDRRDLAAVVFLGTSLTAGLGVTPEQAYPAQLQARIERAGLPFRVVNAGVSGDTSAGGLRRLDWLLQQPMRVLVIELGANDMLRGQSLDALRANLQQIIDRARSAHPDVRIVIAGMQSAPNLGQTYGKAFADTYVELAAANDAVLIPFLLDGVASIPELNQADGIHPNAHGHAVLADNVWEVLEPVLRDVAANAAPPAS